MDPDPQTAPEDRRAGRLLEREPELATVAEAVAGASAGEGRLLVVEGPAGIGKTRLLGEVRRRAGRAGARTLVAAGAPQEREFAFGVVRRLFDPVLAEGDARERRLAGPAAAAEAVLATVVAGGAPAGDASFAALHGLYWLCVNLGEEAPLALIVDDLQWCDASSLRFLGYLARRLDGLPALVAIGLRGTGPDTDPLLVGEVADAAPAIRLRPRPLGAEAVAALIEDRLGAPADPGFTAACRTATDGNPLLLTQLLGSLAAEGVTPGSDGVAVVRAIGARAVSGTVGLRLARLPAAARTVARAVAVLGDDATVPLIAAATGLPRDEVAAASAALIAADVLRPEHPPAFVHPLVRDAVYDDIPPADREIGHARAARLLEEAGRGPERVATHLLLTPPAGDAWVVATLTRAADAARRRGAPESAVAYLSRAMAEPPPGERRPDILIALGLAETLTSGPAAARHLEAALEVARTPAERARIAAALARTLLLTAPAAEARTVAARAVAETPAALVDERRALRALELAARLVGSAGPGDDAWPAREPPADGDGPGTRMLAAITAFGRALTGAPAGECAALAAGALAGGTLLESHPVPFGRAAIAVLVMADRPEAAAVWDEHRAIAHRRGSLLDALTVHLWHGWSLLWRGELREAEASLREARSAFAAWGRGWLTYGPAFLAATLVGRGDLAGADAVLSVPAPRDRDSDGYGQLLRSRAELLLAEGRHEPVLALTDELAGGFGWITNPGWMPWRSLRARALDGLGRTDEAVALADEEVRLARRFSAPGVVGRPLRVLGALRRAEGVDDLREAVAVLEGSSARCELAAALLDLGAALRRGRRPSDSREPLRRAFTLAEGLGAGGLAERARTELYASGIRPPTAALSGAASLTASERRVATLAAEGRSNREIAQALYVTLKTVEVHLSRAYRKLGIRSRRELPRALGA